MATSDAGPTETDVAPASPPLAPDGWVIAHAGPGLDARSFRGHAGVSMAPEFLATDGPRAWLVFASPARGGDRSVRSIQLEWNPSVGVWFAPATPVLQVEPRWPAGIALLDFAVDDRGPIGLGRIGDAFELLRPALTTWTSTELVPALSTADAPGPGPWLVVLPSASPRGVAGRTSGSGDSPEAVNSSGPGGPPSASPAPAKFAEQRRLALLRSATPAERANDPAPGRLELIGPGGVRSDPLPVRAVGDASPWGSTATGGMTGGANDGANDGATGGANDGVTDDTTGGANGDTSVELAVVHGHLWAVRRGPDAFVAEPLLGPATDAMATSADDDPPAMPLSAAPIPSVRGPLSSAGLIVGGLELTRIDGPRADQLEIRRWSADGASLGPPESFELHRIDPMAILGAPMVLGACVFISVIVGVLTSRPRAAPTALTGRLAPGGIRALAAAIDLVPAIILASVVFRTGPGGLTVSLLMFDPSPIPWIGMWVIFTASVAGGDIGRGRTLGRRVLRLHVVDAEGCVPRRSVLVRRWILRSLAVLFPPLAAFWAAHAMCRGVHDLASGTWVIRSARRLELGPGGGPRPGDPVPPDPADD
ncbi:MAG: hypothetical protein AB8G96_13065 [Phycisphaerales bacterium]